MKYIEIQDRRLIVEFFPDGSLKAIHEWTGQRSAAMAWRLEGEAYANAVVLLASKYARRAYHDELSRLLRKYRREYFTPQDIEKARKSAGGDYSAEQKALAEITAPCFLIEPSFRRSLIIQILKR